MKNGIYKGLAPTDESALIRGELIITIDDEEVGIEFATGHEVECSTTARSELRQLSLEEVEAMFVVAATPEETRAAAEAVIVHMIGETSGATFIEAKEVPEDVPKGIPHIILLKLFSEEIDGIFGPSFLFTPDQVANGEFEMMVSDLEGSIDAPGSLPRVANDGRPTRN